MAQTPEILISVLNWKNYSDTIQCLKQLFDLGFSSNEMVVVDNASPNDAVIEIKRAFPEIVILQSNKNAGFAAGHKIAADYAIENKYELLWILNPDVILKESTLKALVQAYRRKGPGIYGSVSVSEHNPDSVEFGGAYGIIDGRRSDRYDFHKGENVSTLQQNYTEIQVGAVEGFSMLIPIEVIRNHGFMDTRFFLYGEETEYCMRLMEEGITTYIVTGSVVVHKGEGSFGTSKKNNPVVAYYRARNYRLIAKKYFGLKNAEILKSVGGVVALILFFTKWPFLGQTIKRKKQLDYFHNLGILHAVFNIKGKRVKPEKFSW